MNISSLNTARLALRAPDPNDASALADMMTPTVSRWLGSWPVPFTPAMASERIAVALRAEVEGLGLSRVIERREGAALLGWVGVWRPGSDARRAILSYWLGEAHHGRHVMSETVPAMIELSFDTWDIDAVEASTHPENLASAAVLRRCGMRPIGERTIFAAARGREEFCLIFEILRPAVVQGGETRRL